jgi:hypothetical protein
LRLMRTFSTEHMRIVGATGAKDNPPTCDGNRRRWHRTTDGK